MSNMIFLNDVGTEIILDTRVDISAATTANILYTKPDGTTGTWVGVVYDTTKVKYTVVTDDLDVTGDWKLQVSVVLPSWSGRGEYAQMAVNN